MCIEVGRNLYDSDGNRYVVTMKDHNRGTIMLGGVAHELAHAHERVRGEVLAEVVEALENAYHAQNPLTMHPADFITKKFELDGHENLRYV